ncbi:PREDICTED: uncharacterized protein LOC108778177 [Cyphomyrmex costatus]|uniref:Uncharacterized protein n=1 Tax=Cyphomyrmex costatus TaxID=456900 RepID=A0A151ICD0_9HYME|nr:PREDICTED: uncharacterized protein LOC108778177 [Cyphomyrmex costatus]KYM97736.1 hypothetical protein ALC62_11565 [Cyphomyrmex costatus]
MSMDHEALIRRQVELQSRIARTIDNLKKSGMANITIDAIDNRLLRLDSCWAKFEQQHDELSSKYWDLLQAHDYWNNDFVSQVEETYLQQRIQLMTMRRSLSAAENPGSSSQVEVRSSVPLATSRSRTTLPRIQLPRFSGKYEDWPAFRDLFLSIVHGDPSTTDVEKLHYLKSCLEKEAARLIKNLPTTAENYTRAWTALQEYYENKRLLVRSCIANFSALQKMKNESAAELRKIFHCVTDVHGTLESVGRPVSSSEDFFVHFIVELMDSRSRREWETSLSGTAEPPSYSTLRTFLEQRLRILEAVHPGKSDSGSGKLNAEKGKPAHTHHAKKPEIRKGRCSLCQAEHSLMLCEVFKGKSPSERVQHVRESHLCNNCLGQHKVSDCPSKRSCAACGERHHSMLHDAHRVCEGTTTSLVAGQSPSEPTVLLATAVIRVVDRFGVRHTARALIDQGSETSLISEALAQKLKLMRSYASIAIFGVGGQQTAIARGRVSLEFTSRMDGPSMMTSALILPRLTIYAGGGGMSARDWPHLRGLELADPDFLATDPIEILLGADVHAVIIRDGIKRGRPCEPVGQNTALGWIISGAADANIKSQYVHTHQCTICDDLSMMVRRFWEQEELPVAAAPLTPEERECEDLFNRTHIRLPDGRYMVRLPVTGLLPDFSNSRQTAARVLAHVERRLERDSTMRTLYCDFMRQ